MADPRRVTHLAQRLGLNLPDTFAGHLELLTDLLQRAAVAIGQAKAQLEHTAILLNLHADVLKLPNGYDTMLNAPGVASLLTDAMKRRIGLARALARDAPILLLDDPVAGLDANSKQEIFRALEGVMSGRTVRRV